MSELNLMELESGQQAASRFSPELPSESASLFDTDWIKTDLKGRSVRGGVVTLGAQGAKFALHFASTVLLARLLTPNDFGLIAMVTAITSFALVFKDIGLSTATVQRAQVSHEQVSTLFWINVGFGVALALLVAGFAPVAAWFYGEPRLVLIMVVLAGAFVFGGLTVQHQALLRRAMRFTALGLAEVFGMFFGVALAVVCAWLGAGYWALIALHLGIPAGTAVAVWVACTWRPGRPVRRSGVRSMLAFGGDITAFEIVNYFSRNLDKILIGKFWGPNPLGLYSRAYSLMMLPMSQIRAPLSTVAVPALSRLQEEPQRYKNAFLRATGQVLMFSLPPVAVLLVGADWIIELVLGPQWFEASRIFAWLGLGAVMQTALIVSGWLFVSQGRSRDFLVWGVVSSAISIVSFVMGLPYGAVGVAAAYTLTGLVIKVPFLVWWMGRRGPVGVCDIIRVLAPFSVIFICIALSGVLMRRLVTISHPAAGLALLCLLTAGVTVGLYAVVPYTRAVARDMRILLRAARNPASRAALSGDPT